MTSAFSVLYFQWCRGAESNCGHTDFQSKAPQKAILHHFQLLKYQTVTNPKLDFVGVYWIMLGYDGYNLVTVFFFWVES